MQMRRARLSAGLEATEEPFLALFLRFFPIALYMEHLAELARSGIASVASRHRVELSKGKFLRFLGILIRFAIFPLPNMEWHWRWPASFPAAAHAGIKDKMSEFIFKLYWRQACIPGV